MKKLFYITGLVLSLIVTACSDDELTTKRPVYPIDENEVPFGAGEGVFTDDKKKDTRTIYEIGMDPITQKPYNFNDYKNLRVSWTNQDTVRVFSPEAPDGYKTADYRVASELEGNESFNENGFLVKLGANGIHWGATGTPQNFYAFYPGISKYVKESLKQNGVVEAYIPTAQEKGFLITWDSKNNVIKNDGTGDWKIISPDMHFCMMTASAQYTPQSGNSDVISLKFNPFVTVLDVLINGPANASEGTYNILSVSIRSKTQDIVGKFTYDFTKTDAEGKFTFLTTSETDNKIATIDCMSGGKPTTLGYGQKLNLKFFLLPRTDILANDLTLSILMEGGNVLTLDFDKNLNNRHVNLASSKINKIKTPPISFTNQSSNWMSLIDDNVYFASQISLPGAKHAYSFKTLNSSGDWNNEGTADGMKGEDVTINFANPTTEIMPFYQTKSIDDLFNSGVRAFDIKVITDDGTAKIFTAGHRLNITLVDFLNNLKKLIKGDNSEATEGAVVSINFAYETNSDQDDWIQKIMSAVQTYDPDGSTLHKVGRETILKDMRGKIGIMVNYNGTQTYNTTYIGIVRGFSSSVQNDEVNRLSLGNGTYFVQNLYQVNNPEITDTSIDGVRPSTGLCPHFILHNEAIGKVTSVDLIQKKKDLIEELFLESQKNNASLEKVFCNELAGFCVVNDMRSTGYRNYADFKYKDYNYIIEDRWMVTKNYKNIRDPQKILSGKKIEDQPSNPTDGQTYFGVNGGDPEKGNGGNTVLFASQINPWAKGIIYNYISNARTPMGIIYMNFAGVKTITLGSKTYDVGGVDMPSLIMTNNFKFDLKKKPTTPAQ